MFETKTIKELENEFDVSIEMGLFLEEAKRRLNKYGKNKLKERKKKSFFSIFINQFKDVLILILCVSAFFSFMLDEIVDASIIFIIILFNAFVGAIQERKAEQALNKIKDLSSPFCVVKRDGKFMHMSSELLVEGDIVLVEEGNKIPADIRFIETHNLQVEEASLTGESALVLKDSKPFIKEVPLSERCNMGYMSTTVISGRGVGIVVKTGMNTEIGKIASLLKETPQEPTLLQKKLEELGKFLGILVVGICSAMFVISLIQKRNAFEMLITSITLAVAAIPEGLPAAVTIVLAIGVQRMVKSNSIIRRLPSVETLGSVSIICSDKTGTLTQNKMSVNKIWIDFKTLSVDEVEKNNELLFKCLVLCNNAIIDKELIGDPSEIALLEFAKEKGYLKSEIEREYKKINEISFDSIRKRMSVIVQLNHKKCIFTKGAIDVVLPLCEYILKDEKITKLSIEDRIEIEKESKKLAGDALRIMALAYQEGETENNLIFVGFVAMKDLPRKEVPESINKLKEAGITTVMITGDHLETAYAIAKEIGITDKRNQCVLGTELDNLNESQLALFVKDKRVFARVTPEHKVKIVKAFKANNYVVAMTGDGINDAPSLRIADIGISMGKIGTDVAKEASDMILMDDNFSSIEKAVEEGRGVYANIRKTVIFLLSSNIGEVLTMFIAILFSFPLPLVAIHILWVNLITDTLPALALGADPKDKGIMKDKPRPLKESLFAKGGIMTIFFFGIFITLVTIGAFLIYPISLIIKSGVTLNLNNIKTVYEIGIGGLSGESILARSRTYAFTSLGLSQLFHMLGMSNVNKSVIHILKNKNILMFLAFFLGIILQIAVIEIPILSEFFKTTRLNIYEWIWIMLLSSLPLVVHEIKVLVKKVNLRSDYLKR